MYIAYQTWANPSWLSGPKLSKRIYGRGETPKDALFNAHFEYRDGQWEQKDNCPNESDLNVEKEKD